MKKKVSLVDKDLPDDIVIEELLYRTFPREAVKKLTKEERRFIMVAAMAVSKEDDFSDTTYEFNIDELTAVLSSPSSVKNRTK